MSGVGKELCTVVKKSPPLSKEIDNINIKAFIIQQNVIAHWYA